MLPIDRCTLASYLNDHLAGSVAALGMLHRMRVAYDNTPLGELMATFEDTLREEQATVRALITRSGENQSAIRSAAAWVGEKVTRLKVGPGQDDESGLELFEALELLSIGFWGRRLLWRSLAHVSRTTEPTAAAAYELLATRAETQLDLLEAERLQAALGALTTTGAPQA